MQHALAASADKEPAALAGRAAQKKRAAGYTGEVSPQEAWDYLVAHDDALLVDVRTLPEWQFVGQPDLSSTRGKLANISWKLYPHFALNPQFAAQLRGTDAGEATAIFFLCRNGGRSLDAARAMTVEGYRYCFNIAGGFEGEPDEQGRRGGREGWKAAGLPWHQG